MSAILSSDLRTWIQGLERVLDSGPGFASLCLSDSGWVLTFARLMMAYGVDEKLVLIFSAEELDT